MDKIHFLINGNEIIPEPDFEPTLIQTTMDNHTDAVPKKLVEMHRNLIPKLPLINAALTADVAVKFADYWGDSDSQVNIYEAFDYFITNIYTPKQ